MNQAPNTDCVSSTGLAALYEAHYFGTYAAGTPLERNETWLSVFAMIADGIVREIRPKSSLDAGCAFGMLVEALRDRGVEAYGFDFSSYAIGQVREDMKAYCWVGSILDPRDRQYDLVTCIEVLEHLRPEDAERAIRHLCRAGDDILFSSSPDEFAEDTHLNVQPMEYWAGLFAKQGFIRDVDFDPLSLGHPAAVRFRKSAEPLHRIVAAYERRFWTLTWENGALRTKALLTKAQLAQQEQALQAKEAAGPDVAALEQTIAEQAHHLEALSDQLRFASDRESELRTLLRDAHAQLLERDEAMAPLRRELEERGRVLEELDRAVKERTAWAERMVAEAEQRGAVIDELQAALAERTAWAERMVAEAEQRGAAIQESNRTTEELQAALADHAARAGQLAIELEERGRVLEELDRAVKERTAWAERMVAEAEQRGAVIDELQAALAERTAWAERMVAEAEQRGAAIDELQAALAASMGVRRALGSDLEQSPTWRRGSPHRSLVRLYRGLRRRLA